MPDSIWVRSHSKKAELLEDFFSRVAADDQAREVRHVRCAGCDKAVAFDEDFDIQLEQAAQGVDPLAAIDVGVGAEK